jgi:anion-transporting  ArsA/GET3 family ATPase
MLLKSLAAHRKLALARNAAVRIAELELRARELLNAFESSGQVSTFAVMLPEPLPDRETERLLAELDRLGLKPQALFVNRTIFAGDAATCGRCRIAAKWQAAVLAKLGKPHSAAEEIFAIRNFPKEIAGATGLRTITHELWRLT